MARLSSFLIFPALRDRYPDLDHCPDGHSIDDVTVLCPKCDRFVLFLPWVYLRRGRIRPLLQGMIIVLTAVIAFAVFGYTELVWPLYWYILLGIVHLYAVVFTRGAALGSATWFLSAATAVSAAWAVLNPLAPSEGPAETVIHHALRIAPLIGWLLTTVYMLLLGRQALSKIEIASSYFLAASTLTLGFWGVWLFYLENGLVNNAIYQMAVGVGLLLPVLCILFLFTLPGRSGWERRPWLLSLGAFALVVLAANVILIEPLVNALAFVLGRFFPRLVGVAPLPDIATNWLGGPEWRTAATSLMLLVAAALVVVRAALEAARLEAISESEIASDSSVDLTAFALVIPDPGIIDGEVVDAPEPSAAIARVEVVTPAGPPAGGAPEQAFEQASFIAKYLGETAYLIIKNIFDTLRRAVYAVLPSLAFSLLAMLMVLVLSKLGEYLRHGPFVDAVSLWGMVLSILVGAVLLCAIAFDFAPNQARQTAPSQGRQLEQEDRRRRTRILGVPVIVIAAGTLLTSLAYFLVSAASWALLPMLWPGGDRPEALLTGDPFIVNLAISTLALGLLAALYAIGRQVENGNGRNTRIPGKMFSIPAAVILMAVAGASVYFAGFPIRSTLEFVNTPYSPAAMQALQARLPAAFAGSCGPDYLLVPGESASLECRDTSDNEVSYHAFSTSDAVDRWYKAATQSRGLAIGVGSCAQQWPAEQPNEDGGRVACYTDRRGAWLLWTEKGLLGIAFRSDGRSDALYAKWSSGAFDLRAG